MSSWGGKRNNSGKLKKADTLKIKNMFKGFEKETILALKENIEKGDIKSIEVYLKYRFGTPTKIVEVIERDLRVKYDDSGITITTNNYSNEN